MQKMAHENVHPKNAHWKLRQRGPSIDTKKWLQISTWSCPMGKNEKLGRRNRFFSIQKLAIQDP
jgi:hypothetical protein